MTHLWLLLFLALSLKIEAQGFRIDLNETLHNDEAEIKCNIALLGKYFQSGDALSGSVLHVSITTASTDVQQSLLHALHTDPIYPWTIVVENTQHERTTQVNIKHVLHEKPQCYFFVIENTEEVDMDEIFENWMLNLNWNPLAQFVVYFSSVEETDEEMTDVMIEILLSFMNKKIYNVNVIGRSEDVDSYICKTVFPYHPDNNCGNRIISVETLDICGYLESESDYEESEEETVESENNSNRDNNLTEGFLKTNKQKELQDLTGSSQQSNYRKLYIEEIYSGLFLEKFPRDLSGCPLKAAFRPWEPYIFHELLNNSLHTIALKSEENNQTSYNYSYEDEERVDEDYINDDKEQNVETKATDDVSKIPLNGIEYKMLQTIAERLHINIEMQIENSNLYHLFQQLIDGDVEMIVGGIDEDPSLSQFVSSTIPYHQDDLTWCVARAQHTYNLFNFMATFETRSWLLIFLFILTAALFILMSQHCLKRHLGFPKSYLRINIYVMSIILSQSINLRPIPISLKLCLAATFIMGLMFTSIYQSFLVSTLTTPKTLYQISHLNEIYQNRMHIMGSVENVRHLNNEGEIYRYIREQFEMCYNIGECLQHAAKDTKLAVIVSRQHFLYNPRIPHDRLYCFDRNENIYVYLVTILMPKKFHLLHKINPVIQHIIESGHMQKWARDLDMRRKINEQMQHNREQQLQSLTLSQVAGSFAFNGLLLAIALWIFSIECYVHWLVVRRRTRLKLAKYVHRRLI